MNERELFIAAIQLEGPSERTAYLEKVCQGDPEIKQRVEVLVEAFENAGSFLQANDAAAVAATCDLSASDRVADHIGPYKLLEKIGEGGMGVVWLAEQHEPVRRRVALKLIKPGMDSRLVLARFEAERHALSMMDHPNIAKVLDAGAIEAGGRERTADYKLPVKDRPGPAVRESVPRVDAPPSNRQPAPSGLQPNSRPYFVMELVKGQPITDYCDEHHLNPRERLELFVPVCHAIQHAHQKGIIHRDIKPSNVLVAEYDGRPVAKVIDFGVAKATHQPLTEMTMFTGLGQIIGTLEYMSPEQARVNQLDIDTRSDIYSLGVLLYELLTGSTPFDKQRMRDAALDELLRIIREEEPPRPSTKLSSSQTLPNIAANRRTEPARLSTIVRGELDWIVMKSLEKDRNRRYETANGFAMDVQRYLAGEVVEACPPSVSYRIQKFTRRNKALLATVSMLTVALTMGLLATTWQAIRATRAEQLALANEQRAIAERDEKEVARREAMTSAEQARLSADRAEQAATQERLAAESEHAAREAEMLQRLIAQAAEKRANDEAATAKAISEFLRKDLLQLASAEGQLAYGLSPDPNLRLITLLERSHKILEDRFSDQPEIRAELQLTLSEAFHQVGRLQDAVQLAEVVSAYYADTRPAEDTKRIEADYFLANLYISLGKYSEAQRLLDVVLSQRLRLLGEDHPLTYFARADRAKLLHHQGNFNQSIIEYENLLEGLLKSAGPAHPFTAVVQGGLASVLADLGRFNEALPLEQASLAATQSNFGFEHPRSLQAQLSLANLYLRLQQLDQAELLFKKSIDEIARVLGDEHPQMADALNDLAMVYYAQDDFEAMEPIAARALKLSETIYGDRHPDTLTALNNLALCYDAQNRIEVAIPLMEQIVKLREEVQGPNDLYTWIAMNNLATSLNLIDRAEEGLKLLEEVAARSSQLLADDHPTVLTFQNNLAKAYFERNQSDACLGITQRLAALLAEGAPSPQLATIQLSVLTLHGKCLLRLERWNEAEVAIRKALSIRESMDPNSGSVYATMSLLGECLLGQSEFIEAEQLLLDGYSGMTSRQETLPEKDLPRLFREAAERLVRLYEAWNKPSDLAKWESELKRLSEKSEDGS